MNLLAIETATDVCSVAILSRGAVVASEHLQRPRAHSERLVPMIAACLKKASLTPGDVDVVALSAGPGSYTGLRIGAATAKGLIFATGARLCAVSTLEALAHPLFEAASQPIVSILPSRKGECYVAAWAARRTGPIEQMLEPSIVRIDELRERLMDVGLERGAVAIPAVPGTDQIQPGEAVAGDWPNGPLQMAVQALESAGGFALHAIQVSAEHVAHCALPAIEQDLFEDASAFEPYYMGVFEARKPSRSAFDRLRS